MKRTKPLLHRIAQKPVIAAIRRTEDIDRAIASQVDHLFFMGGSIQEIAGSVRQAKEAGKGAFVHVDLIKGLSSTDKEAVRFIAETIGADGIVTPKAHLIKEAKKHGLYGILHLFILDSAALEGGLAMIGTVEPDAVEIMPGAMPKVISAFADASDHTPVIASGLIRTREEALTSLQAGATALSVGESKLWDLTMEDIYNNFIS